MFEKLLVPLDGSHRSEAVLRPVSTLARALGSQVTLLYVFEDPAVDVSLQAEAARAEETAGEERERLLELARQYLEEVAERLRKLGVSSQAVAIAGRPHDVIAHYARREGHSFIAMASRGRGPLPGLMLGSVTHRVLHASTVPVLVVRPRRQGQFWTAPQRFSRIMVPLDGSAQSEAALPYAQELARRLALPVFLFQVIPVSAEVPLGASAVAFGGEEIFARGDTLATSYLAGVGRRLSEAGLRVDWDAVRGPLVPTIVEWVNQQTGTLVVMAKRGRSGIADWMGSVTEAVIRQARVAVMVVPPGKTG